MSSVKWAGPGASKNRYYNVSLNEDDSSKSDSY